MDKKMPQFYLVCGLSCCGKSVFAKQFADANDLIRVDIDEVYRLYNGDDVIRDNYFEVWQTVFSIINCAQRNRKNILLDTSSLNYEERQQFVFLFPGFEHHLIYIYADPKIREQNMQTRRRKIPDDVLQSMQKRLEEPRKDERGWKSIRFFYNDGKTFTEMPVPEN